jgi:hypothetical protein
MHRLQIEHAIVNGYLHGEVDKLQRVLGPGYFFALRGPGVLAISRQGRSLGALIDSVLTLRSQQCLTTD